METFLEGIQADLHKYMHKLEPTAVPTTDVFLQEKTAFLRLLAQDRWPVNHVLLQFSHFVGETGQKPEDGWSATDG